MSKYKKRSLSEFIKQQLTWKEITHINVLAIDKEPGFVFRVSYNDNTWQYAYHNGYDWTFGDSEELNRVTA